MLEVEVHGETTNAEALQLEQVVAVAEPLQKLFRGHAEQTVLEVVLHAQTRNCEVVQLEQRVALTLSQ